jgi:hypothetical protein
MLNTRVQSGKIQLEKLGTLRKEAAGSAESARRVRGERARTTDISHRVGATARFKRDSTQHYSPFIVILNDDAGL